MATEPKIKLEVLSGDDSAVRASGRKGSVVSVQEPVMQNSPGEILKQAREQQGMDVLDVCDRLRLQPWVVEALESDEYQKLAAPTYARGYLRNYAALLEVPEEDVLGAYDRVRSDKPASAANAVKMVNGSETRPVGADGPSKWAPVMAVALLVGIVGLFAAWWFGDRGAPPVPVVAEQQSEPAVSNAPALNSGYEITRSSVVGATDTSDDRLSLAGGLMSGGANESAGEVADTDLRLASDQYVASNTGGDIGLTSEQLAAAEAEAAFEASTLAADVAVGVDEATVVPVVGSDVTSDLVATGDISSSTAILGSSDEPALATTYPVEGTADAIIVAATTQSEYAEQPVSDGRTRISLYFQQDSWAEVRDSRGSQLIYRLGQAGSAADVRGYPPFKVFLGNSPGVEVELDGLPFDTSKYNRRNNTARFQVGADS